MPFPSPSAGRARHWLIALLALAALASGYALTRTGAYSATLLQLHLALGASAGLLSLVRVLTWLANGAPPPVFEPGTRLQAALAKTVHMLLRLCPVVLMVSGAGMIALSGTFAAIADNALTSLAPFAELPPRGLHHAAALLLSGLAGFHGLAALWHTLKAPDARSA